MKKSSRHMNEKAAGRVAHELRQAYNIFLMNYGEVLNFSNNKARNAEWWTTAVPLCNEFGIDPPNLLVAVLQFVNRDASGVSVPKGPTLFRSRELMVRALVYYRDYLCSHYEQMKDVRVVKTTLPPDFKPSNSTPLAVLEREVATLSREYFHYGCKVLCTHNLQRLPTDWELDLYLYENCKNNPYLLVGRMATPRMRAIAAVNARIRASREPWNAGVWSTVPDMPDLEDVAGNAGDINLLREMYPGKYFESWPFDPYGGLLEPWLDMPTGYLTFISPLVDGMVDFYFRLLNLPDTSSSGPLSQGHAHSSLRPE